MSREVQVPSDLSELEEDDLLYLAQRDQLPHQLVREYGEEEIREMVAAGEPGLFPNTGTVNPAPSSSAGESTDPDERRALGLDDDEEYEALEPPYDAYSKDELINELAHRELDVNGKKAELVERLDENDAEQADDGS